MNAGKAAVGILLASSCLACTSRGTSGLAAEPAPIESPSANTVMTASTHPGTIRMVDLFTKEVTEVAASSVPDEQRFVYLKDGRETDSAAEATETIPIVEVRMLPLDAAGNLVDRRHAVRIRIVELGANGQTLRTTLMVPR